MNQFESDGTVQGNVIYLAVTILGYAITILNDVSTLEWFVVFAVLVKSIIWAISALAVKAVAEWIKNARSKSKSKSKSNPKSE